MTRDDSRPRTPTRGTVRYLNTPSSTLSGRLKPPRQWHGGQRPPCLVTTPKEGLRPSLGGGTPPRIVHLTDTRSSDPVSGHLGSCGGGDEIRHGPRMSRFVVKEASKPPGSRGVSPSSLCGLHFPFAAGFTLNSGALRAPCLSVREGTSARWTPGTVEPGQCRGETWDSDSSMESGRLKEKGKGRKEIKVTRSVAPVPH